MTANSQDLSLKRSQRPIMANISNRHIHLCAGDLEKLFGPGYELKKIKDLMQPGEYASKETVKIVGKRREIEKVRILGPLRKATQVEISKTDSVLLGLNAPLRSSGDVKGSASVKIVGPFGTVDLAEGCIVAQRHIHMTPADASFYEVVDNQIVSIRTTGERGLIFENILARVSEKMSLECHLDTDEANAADLKNGDLVVLL